MKSAARQKYEDMIASAEKCCLNSNGLTIQVTAPWGRHVAIRNHVGQRCGPMASAEFTTYLSPPEIDALIERLQTAKDFLIEEQARVADLVKTYHCPVHVEADNQVNIVEQANARKN